MEYVVTAIIGYLLGAVPAAVLVARRHGVDLRRTGDGNPGAWNALEQLGARRAWPAFAGDGLKGLVAGLAGLALAGWWAGYTGVAAAMVGHAWPPLGRGGKAVMAFAGGAFALSPFAALAALAACVAIGAATGARWGARAGVFGFPAIQLAFDPPARVAATGALMCLIGALFLLRRRSAPATSGEGAATTGSAGRP